jgi:ComF family protein
MAISINTYINAFQQLFFPHSCAGCGADYIHHRAFLCAACNHTLPSTHFFEHSNNPVEQVFTGRIPLVAGGASFYFYKAGLIQHLISQLKYKNNLQAGRFLGRCMGRELRESARFTHIDLLVPLPLHPKKEFQRGYNQARIICEGIMEVWPKKLCTQAISRLVYTSSQTQGNRVNRLRNMENAFWASEPNMIKNKNILLIDDVITTGASLEACGKAILQVPGTTISVASAAFTV